MRTTEGQEYGFFRSMGNYVKNAGTELVLKTVGVGVLGGIAGIGFRTANAVFIEGKYTGDFVYRIIEGVKEFTPFVDGRNNLTDATQTLSAGLAAASMYFGGRLVTHLYKKSQGHYKSNVQGAAEHKERQAPFEDLDRRVRLETATIAAEENIGIQRATSKRRLRDLGAV